jgi:polyisoprenoid-binding protein YceI
MKKMKKKLRQELMMIAVCLLGSTLILQAQSNYKINDSKDIDMKLSGTSTLHNWTMDAKTFSGDAQFDFSPGSVTQLSSIKSLTFSLVVQNLKSGEGGMDKNAYKALKTGQYKDIDYKLVSATVMPEKNGKYLIKTQGNLTIAGVTKLVAMDVLCVVNKDGTITVTGSDKLEMTDYKVKPPTFMLGAMKTGDAITLDYTLVYKK